MKKIIYLANARIPTEKAHGYQICKMCEAFSEAGAEVKLFHPGRRQPESLAEHDLFKFYGIREVFDVSEIPNWDIFKVEKYVPSVLFGPLFFLHSFFWGYYVARFARGFSADLFYTREITTAFWLTALGMPAALELHTVPGRIQKRLLRRLSGQPALKGVFVLTRFIRERLGEFGFDPKAVTVMPDGVDLRLFEGLPKMQACRHRLELPADRPIVGYIGRFRTMGLEKGLPELIRATAVCFKKGRTDILLLCVGGPLDRVNDYLAIAAEAGLPPENTLFLDRVPATQVPWWIRACSVVTIPWTWSEFSAFFTSPLKLFEYMASGVPIVASDLPSLKEILVHDETAWMVPPDDPDQLAEGISRMLERTASAERIAASACRAVRQYTWLARSEGILRELFAGAPENLNKGG